MCGDFKATIISIIERLCLFNKEVPVTTFECSNGRNVSLGSMLRIPAVNALDRTSLKLELKLELSCLLGCGTESSFSVSL